MKTNYPYQSIIRFVCVAFLTISVTVQSNAQDLFIQQIDLPPPVIFANQPAEIFFVLGNNSPNPAGDLFINVQILDVPGGQEVFNWQFQLPGLPPFGEMPISTQPDLWWPPFPGDYFMVIQVETGNDQNPTNNQAFHEIQAIPQPEVMLEQIDMVSPFDVPNSTNGILRVDVPPLPDPLFLNVIGRLPGSTEEGWIVQNMPLLPFPEPQLLDYWFDLEPLGLLPGNNLNELDLTMSVTDIILADSFPVLGWNTFPVFDVQFDVPSDNPAEDILLPPIDVTFPEYDLPQQLEWLYRGCTVPNIDLDRGGHPATADYAGDLNACGPAAAANSLQWLEDTHPKIPATGTTHREKMEELSKQMSRANEAGVNTNMLVQGKLGFIDKHKLPIHVKYQSWYNSDSTIASPDPIYGHTAENKSGMAGTRKPPTWEFLKSEMKKGEDVEILFGWYDRSANRNGGHWVTVTGISENENYKGIYIKDDGTQRDTGGTRQSYHNWHEENSGWSRLLGYDGPNNWCWVESVVSESYDSTVTHEIFNLELEWLQWLNPSFSDPYNLHSLFSFNYPPLPFDRYINVKASLPGSTEKEWIIRNVLLPADSVVGQLSIWWDMAWIGVVEGQPIDRIELEVGIDEDFNVDSFFDITYRLELEPQPTSYYVGETEEDAPVQIQFTTPQLPTFTNVPEIKLVFRGCTMPNIDLDSASHNPTNTPGYSGDKNACFPAAAANSMHWLETTHPKIDSVTTHRQKLEELSGAMSRADNRGVRRKHFIEGKLAYIDNHKLPIHVKFQGFKFGTDSTPSPNSAFGHFAENKNDTAFAKPQWDFLVQEMEKGEDVEIEYGKYDTTGTRVGGHAITVTGVLEVGGVKGIYFKDDIRQRAAGGLRHQYVNWMVDSLTGHVLLPQLSDRNHGRWVESIISESYDSTITFTTRLFEPDVKEDFGLSIYRNPSSIAEGLIVRFNLPAQKEVTIELFDIIGRRLEILRQGSLGKGEQSVPISPKHMNIAGTYLVVLSVGDQKASVKVIRE